MDVLVSRAERRLLVRIDSGEAVAEALVRVAQQHAVTAAEVRGVGVLEEVALCTFDAVRERFHEPRALKGAVELVQLTGFVALHAGIPTVSLFATVARTTDNGLELVGGRVATARAALVEVTLGCFDDVALERVSDPATTLAPWAGASGARSSSSRTQGSGPTPRGEAPRAPQRYEPAPAPTPVAARYEAPAPARYEAPPREERRPEPPRRPEPSPASSSSSSGATTSLGGGMKSLADVAKALEAMPDRSDEIEDKLTRPEPEAGDIFDHPSYGLVEYLGDTATGHARIRRSNGSVKELSLDVFTVSPLPPRGGKRAWALRSYKR